MLRLVKIKVSALECNQKMNMNILRGVLFNYEGNVFVIISNLPPPDLKTEIVPVGTMTGELVGCKILISKEFEDRDRYVASFLAMTVMDNDRRGKYSKTSACILLIKVYILIVY